MAGYEIGVEMGQEDVADLKTQFFSVRQVLLDVALRIDDNSDRACLILSR